VGRAAAKVAARTSPEPLAEAKRVVGPTPSGRVARAAIVEPRAVATGWSSPRLTPPAVAPPWPPAGGSPSISSRPSPPGAAVSFPPARRRCSPATLSRPAPAAAGHRQIDRRDPQPVGQRQGAEQHIFMHD
jgi:hypothetical protein